MMKICKVTSDIYPLYEPYIPQMYASAHKNRDYLVMGLYDETGQRGAAIINTQQDTAYIVSLLYDKDIEPGCCEKEIADVILSGFDKTGVAKVVYVHEGSVRELESFDYSMMEAGFFPMRGEVKRFSATLLAIYDAQKKGIESTKKGISKMPIITGEHISDYQIKHYNQKHPDNPFRKAETDPRICLFYLKENLPVAGVFARESEDHHLVMTWMDYDPRVEVIIRLRLIHALILYAMKYYPPDTKVIVCPFNNEVAALVNKFGFEPDRENAIQTHIYTKYADND